MKALNFKFSGYVHKLGDNIDTDRIIPAPYLAIQDHKILAKHCLEGIVEDFYKKVKDQDVIVAGRNFGCGSSREHAVFAIKACGIKAILAKSFARIFFRNAINNGLVVVEFAQADRIPDGDFICVDLEEGYIYSHTLKEHFPIPPYPPFILDILKSGGLLAHLKMG